jgi:ATPase family AAA domain-containing protein 3A/B
MPLSFYEFAYDSVAGRRQIGVLPRDAAKNFPGSVEVVESYTFPPKKKGESPTVVPNFPVVDKNVIFMHGIAALQELIKTTDDLSDSVQGVTGALEGDIQEMKKIAEALDKDHSSRVRAFERQAAADLKREAAMEQLRVGASSLDEKHAAAALEQESRLLSLNEKAAIARLEKERELARESAQALLDAEKKLAEGSEARHAAAAAAQKEREIALEAELVLKRADADKARIRAESEARIKEELAQEDIAIRRIQAKGKLDSDRAVLSIKLVFSEVQAVVQEVLSSPERLFYIVGVLLLLLATYFVLRELIVLFREYVQAQIGKPALVRETSYTWSPVRTLLTPVRALLRVVGVGSGGVTSASIERDIETLKRTFEHVVLEPSLKERIIQLAVSTRNTARSGACYRHLLLHGPPGTGKTLIARTLAQSSGLDYAIMSGGDVGPLGEDAVNQLHRLFRWAQRSEKGLLVFIDESEAFLHSRDGMHGGDGMGGGGDDSVHRRHALNALLYQTGTQSTKLLLVLATNRPEDLDEAVVDRMDASLLIDLPCLEERVAQCHLYVFCFIVFPSRVCDVSLDLLLPVCILWHHMTRV